jgi:hypothetical protein
MAGRKAGGDGGDPHANVIEVSALAMTGSADENLALVLISQVRGTLSTSGGLSEAQVVNGAVAALKGLAPRDELEGMLAAQMVATHSAAMECLRRATNGQTLEGRDQDLKHATKLLGMYARQVEALDKHRGKGQQTITVEHVTVNAGGQAVVGNFEGRATAASAGPLALSNNPDPLAPAIEAASIAKPGRKTPVRR